MFMIKCSFVNKTKGYIFSQEPFEQTAATSRGKLFRQLQKEFGRCVSKIYVDQTDGTIKQIGWTFERMEEYSDNRGSRRDKYVREVWVEVVEK